MKYETLIHLLDEELGIAFSCEIIEGTKVVLCEVHKEDFFLGHLLSGRGKKIARFLESNFVVDNSIIDSDNPFEQVYVGYAFSGFDEEVRVEVAMV